MTKKMERCSAAIKSNKRFGSLSEVCSHQAQEGETKNQKWKKRRSLTSESVKFYKSPKKPPESRSWFCFVCTRVSVCERTGFSEWLWSTLVFGILSAHAAHPHSHPSILPPRQGPTPGNCSGKVVHNNEDDGWTETIQSQSLEDFSLQSSCVSLRCVSLQIIDGTLCFWWKESADGRIWRKKPKHSSQTLHLKEPTEPVC